MASPATTPLKRLLIGEGRKQSWLAERTGIDRATVSRIAQGLPPSEPQAQALAEALGREISELWPVADEKAAA
jgi:transcriptional regulator with XRE-family HTH domain